MSLPERNPESLKYTVYPKQKLLNEATGTKLTNSFNRPYNILYS